MIWDDSLRPAHDHRFLKTGMTFPSFQSNGIRRSTFSPSTLDATSYPSRYSVGRKSCDLSVGQSDAGSSRSHDTLSTLDWLG